MIFLWFHLPTTFFTAVVLKLHAPEAPEEFLQTQLAEPHPLEFLICRSRMEPAICMFNKLLGGAHAASQGGAHVPIKLGQLFYGIRKTKEIR